jgi:hypothetical protein
MLYTRNQHQRLDVAATLLFPFDASAHVPMEYRGDVSTVLMKSKVKESSTAILIRRWCFTERGRFNAGFSKPPCQETNLHRTTRP